jgi:hypothetical protein
VHCQAAPKCWHRPACFPVPLTLSHQAIISAAGKNFCGGLDLSYLNNTFGAKMRVDPAAGTTCPARLRDGFRQDILLMQVSVL